MGVLGEGQAPGLQDLSPPPPPLPLLSEPICAVGHGVAALCCATNEDRSWVFRGYSVTGVSAARPGALGPEARVVGTLGPMVPSGR